MPLQPCGAGGTPHEAPHVVRHTFFISPSIESWSWNQGTKQDFLIFNKGDTKTFKYFSNTL
jgi:hypothetical protein